jgi:hypothetical protein
MKRERVWPFALLFVGIMVLVIWTNACLYFECRSYGHSWWYCLARR